MAEQSVATMHTTEDMASPMAPLDIPSACQYFVATKGGQTDLIGDAKGFLNYAAETVLTVAMELSDEGSQLTANPKAVSTLLFGAQQFLEMAKGILDAALSQRDQVTGAAP